MNPDTQRLTIAKECEFHHFHLSAVGAYFHWAHRNDNLWPEWRRYDQEGPDCPTHDLPDFLNDANAMTRAEESHPHLNWPTFIRNLAKIVRAVVDFEEEPDTGDFWLILHATPAQRAEAFLRSLNLYTSP